MSARQKAVLEEEVRFWKIEVTLAVERTCFTCCFASKKVQNTDAAPLEVRFWKIEVTLAF